MWLSTWSDNVILFLTLFLWKNVNDLLLNNNFNLFSCVGSCWQILIIMALFGLFKKKKLI